MKGVEACEDLETTGRRSAEGAEDPASCGSLGVAQVLCEGFGGAFGRIPELETVRHDGDNTAQVELTFLGGINATLGVAKHEGGTDGGEGLGGVEFDVSVEVEVGIEVEAKIAPHDRVRKLRVLTPIQGDAEGRKRARVLRDDEMGNLKFVRFENDANGLEELDKDREERA